MIPPLIIKFFETGNFQKQKVTLTILLGSVRKKGLEIFFLVIAPFCFAENFAPDRLAPPTLSYSQFVSLSFSSSGKFNFGLIQIPMFGGITNSSLTLSTWNWRWPTDYFFNELFLFLTFLPIVHECSIGLWKTSGRGSRDFKCNK